MLMLDGELVLQLHHADAEEHGDTRLPASAPRGAGVLLYVEVPDVHAAHRKAIEMGATVEGEPTFIELARHTELGSRPTARAWRSPVPTRRGSPGLGSGAQDVDPADVRSRAIRPPSGRRTASGSSSAQPAPAYRISTSSRPMAPGPSRG